MGNVVVRTELKFLSEFLSIADGGGSDGGKKKSLAICLPSSDISHREELWSYHHLCNNNQRDYGRKFSTKRCQYFFLHVVDRVFYIPAVAVTDFLCF